MKGNPKPGANMEESTITLGEYKDDLQSLEMITANVKEESIINQKLKNFHSFVKNTKTPKHPWEKLFMKNYEYKKSEVMYRKMLWDTIEKMRGFNNRRIAREGKMLNEKQVKGVPTADCEEYENEDEDEDYDEDEEEEDEETYSNGMVCNPQNSLSLDQIYMYSDKGKPERNVGDAWRRILDFSKPENCTEMKGFGIFTLQCIADNYKKQIISRGKAIRNYVRVFSIWILIYASVAIPLWCIKGWCCCWFNCYFCRPRKVLKDIQEYIRVNPPGVFVNEFSEEEHFAPGIREIELYEKINRKILRL